MTTCHGCHKLIRPGEARYTGGEGADPPRYWHWDCHEQWLADLRERMLQVPSLVARFQTTISRLRQR